MPDDATLGISAEQIASLSPESRTTIDQQLQQAGYTVEQRNRLGLTQPLIQPVAPPPMDLRSANLELRLNTDRFQKAGTTPSDYRVGLDPRSLGDMTAQDTTRLREAYQSAFHAGEIPTQSAQAIVTTSMQSAKHFAALDDKQRKAFESTEEDAFNRLSTRTSVQFNFAYAWNKLPADFKIRAIKEGWFVTAASKVSLAAAGQFMMRRDTK